MNNNLTVKVSSKQDKAGNEFWEGTVALPGLTGKLVRKSDGTTRFTTKAAVNQAARNLAKDLGYEIEFMGKTEQKTTTKTPAKKAAKKSVQTTCCSGESCTPSWLN